MFTQNKMTKVVLLLSLILVLSWSEGWSKQTLSITTEDHKQISATYYSPPSCNAAALILIPDTRCDGSQFGGIPSKLNKAGFEVLVMDLRYKQLIAQARSREEQIKVLLSQDTYTPVNYDIKSGFDLLVGQKDVNPERICLIGTSYGARVALHSGVKYKVKALILVSLSGQEALPGKPVQELLEEYGSNPVLFMTSEKDWGGNYKAAEHNKLYFDWAKGKKELKIWPGSAHGIGILDKDKALDFTITWLKENL
jgi:dienelactone hydrolase